MTKNDGAVAEDKRAATALLIRMRLPRSDSQTTTQPGDIVLYSGSQMVIFYGSNAWAYTRLGRITDRTDGELTELLGHGDITATLDISPESPR